MYSQIIKARRKIPYFVLGSILFIYIVISTITNIHVFNHEEISRLNQLVKRSKIANRILDTSFKKLVERDKIVFKNSIHGKDLAKSLRSLCSILVDNKVMENCLVGDIKSPYLFTNVAKFSINSSDVIDRLTIKRVLSEIYYIKGINELPLGVEFEIYSKIN